MNVVSTDNVDIAITTYYNADADVSTHPAEADVKTYPAEADVKTYPADADVKRSLRKASSSADSTTASVASSA